MVRFCDLGAGEVEARGCLSRGQTRVSGLASAGFGMVTLFRSRLRAFRVAGGKYFFGVWRCEGEVGCEGDHFDRTSSA